ncbi:hypothetical protein Glove_155g32 [Diversispora epigaea]|uniref:Uncharacterized protein n=1 Tax=Diversispora epigaea TaxID=1348612 RepID=A0A397IYN5_9GLOM|nr:hypothetical protein Glove_155g32 [Diversispora epigaea]
MANYVSNQVTSNDVTIQRQMDKLLKISLECLTLGSNSDANGQKSQQKINLQNQINQINQQQQREVPFFRVGFFKFFMIL